MRETIRGYCERVWTFVTRHSAACIAITFGVITGIVLTIMLIFLRPVVVYDGDQRFEVLTFSRDADEILDGLSIELSEHDHVEARLNSPTPLVRVYRAFTVTVEWDGETKTLPFAIGTVGDVLEHADIGEEYRLIDRRVEEPVTAPTTIRLTAHTFSIRTETAVLEHETELTFTDAVPSGGRQLVRAGQDGELQTVYRDYFDAQGNLLKTELVLETVTREPITELSEVGSGALSVAKIPIELGEDGHPVTYKEVLTGDACAYYFKKGTGTATGKQCKNGVVAVDPDVIPYGSKLFIIADDGYVYGYAEAVDSGEAVRDGLIIVDLFMESYKQTCEFGRRHVSVYILE